MGTDLYAVRVAHAGETDAVFPRQRADIGSRVLDRKKVRGRSKLKGDAAFDRAVECLQEDGAEAASRMLFDLLCNDPKTPFTNVARDWPAPVPCEDLDAWRAHFDMKRTTQNRKWRLAQAKLVSADLDEALATKNPFAWLAERYEAAFHRAFWLAQNATRAVFPDHFDPVSAAEVVFELEDIHSQGREVGLPKLGTIDSRMNRFASLLIRDHDYFESPLWKRYGEIMNQQQGVAGELIYGVEQREWQRRSGELRVAIDARWLGGLKVGDEYRSRAY